MGRLVVNNSMSVNGAFEAPSPEPDGWLVLDPDSTQVALEQFYAADAMVLGRTTYEGLAAVWPTLVDVPLTGRAVDADAAREAADAARAAVAPRGHLHASVDYLRHVTGVLAERAVLGAWEDAA